MASEGLCCVLPRGRAQCQSKDISQAKDAIEHAAKQVSACRGMTGIGMIKAQVCVTKVRTSLQAKRGFVARRQQDHVLPFRATLAGQLSSETLRNDFA